MATPQPQNPIMPLFHLHNYSRFQSPRPKCCNINTPKFHSIATVYATQPIIPRPIAHLPLQRLYSFKTTAPLVPPIPLWFYPRRCPSPLIRTPQQPPQLGHTQFGHNHHPSQQFWLSLYQGAWPQLGQKPLGRPISMTKTATYTHFLYGLPRPTATVSPHLAVAPLECFAPCGSHSLAFPPTNWPFPILRSPRPPTKSEVRAANHNHAPKHPHTHYMRAADTGARTNKPGCAKPHECYHHSYLILP